MGTTYDEFKKFLKTSSKKDIINYLGLPKNNADSDYWHYSIKDTKGIQRPAKKFPFLFQPKYLHIHFLHDKVQHFEFKRSQEKIDLYR